MWIEKESGTFIKLKLEKSILSIKWTIHPGLRLVPSGNLFLALNRSHHFLLKKSEFNKASWAQWFKLDNFISILSIFQQCKIIKIESLSSSCLIKFWLFLTKNDDFYVKPKKNSRMAQSWGQAELSPCSRCFFNISAWNFADGSRILQELRSEFHSISAVGKVYDFSYEVMVLTFIYLYIQSH